MLNTCLRILHRTLWRKTLESRHRRIGFRLIVLRARAPLRLNGLHPFFFSYFFFIDAKESLLEDNRALSKRGAVRSSIYKWPTSNEDGKTVVKIPYVVQDGV